jgi:tRNA threonylcarbamoyladenosine biosynthesis protein TsaB
MNGLVLAADTSTQTETVAVLRGAQVLSERAATRGRGHGPSLLELVHGALGDAEVEVGALDALVCGLGPGSFTGLRVVLATLKGLALALERPLYGVPTAQAFTAAHPGRSVVVVTDARRGEVFLDGAMFAVPVGCKPDEAGARLPAGLVAPLMLGNGALLHRDTLLAGVPDADVPDVALLHAPRAALLAVGLERRSPASLAGLEPLYVRRSDAELNYPDGFPNATTVPRQRRPKG